MNFKTTLILIVLLAAAGAFLFFTHEPASKTETTAIGNEDAKLLDIDSKDVTKIVVAPAEGSPFTLEKQGTDWRLTDPVKAAAETWEVDSLVRAMTEARTHGEIDAIGDNAESTGLMTPRYQIQIVTSAKTIKLSVGSKSAVGDNLYVKLDGKEKADIIGGDLSDKLAKGADTFRKTNLVSASSSDIKQITITRPDMKLALQKPGTGWQVTEPARMPADDGAVSDLTFALTGLRADSYVDSKAVPASAFAKPQLTVAFTSTAPVIPPATAPSTAPVWTTIQFGSYEDVLKKNVYVNVDGTVAKVAATSLDTFRKKQPLDLRDKKVVDLDAEQVNKIMLVIDLPSTTQPTTRPAISKSVTIERRKVNPVLGPALPATEPTTGPSTSAVASTQSTQPATAPVQSKWMVTSEPQGDADDSKVATLLTGLHPLKAEKYMETAPTTQPTGQYKLTVTTVGPGGSPVTDHQITLVDPGHDQPLIGSYNGLNFETARSVLSNLEGEWINK